MLHLPKKKFPIEDEIYNYNTHGLQFLKLHQYRNYFMQVKESGIFRLKMWLL